jgi:hypothetical protein
MRVARRRFARREDVSPHRKAAYRHLLYAAMLDIRGIGGRGLGYRWWRRPLRWPSLVRAARRAGDVADWLHNLAFFTAHDLVGFSEEWFWREYEQFCRRDPDFDRWGYKDRFDRMIAENERGADAPRPD